MIIEGVGSREGEEEGDKRKPCTQQWSAWTWTGSFIWNMWIQLSVSQV
jgi:hypothetical protein